jgi:hypothetical protein
MKTSRLFMILSLVLTLTVNVLANALPINGLTTGEISDRFPILFVPEGYVFRSGVDLPGIDCFYRLCDHPAGEAGCAH